MSIRITQLHKKLELRYHFTLVSIDLFSFSVLPRTSGNHGGSAQGIFVRDGTFSILKVLFCWELPIPTSTSRSKFHFNAWYIAQRNTRM